MTPKLKLLDQVRAVARAKHLSHRTEDTYRNFIKHYILFHDKHHPKEMEPGIKPARHLKSRSHFRLNQKAQDLFDLALAEFYTDRRSSDQCDTNSE